MYRYDFIIKGLRCLVKTIYIHKKKQKQKNKLVFATANKTRKTASKSTQGIMDSENDLSHAKVIGIISYLNAKIRFVS